MSDRGQYGRASNGTYGYPHGYPYIGQLPAMPRNLTPWIVGGIGAALVGLVMFGSHAAGKQGPQLTAHDKEVRAWEKEFPGLPWYADQVKSAEQMDTWERARDYWEKKHG